MRYSETTGNIFLFSMKRFHIFRTVFDVGSRILVTRQDLMERFIRNLIE